MRDVEDNTSGSKNKIKSAHIRRSVCRRIWRRSGLPRKFWENLIYREDRPCLSVQRMLDQYNAQYYARTRSFDTQRLGYTLGHGPLRDISTISLGKCRYSPYLR